MTSQSELVSPITDASGVSTGTDELRGQVMAADDDDDMTWLEDVQDPRSEEGDRRATRGVQRRPEVQSMGRSFPDIIVHHQRNMTIQLRPGFFRRRSNFKCHLTFIEYASPATAVFLCMCILFLLISHGESDCDHRFVATQWKFHRKSLKAALKSTATAQMKDNFQKPVNDNVNIPRLTLRNSSP